MYVCVYVRAMVLYKRNLLFCKICIITQMMYFSAPHRLQESIFATAVFASVDNCGNTATDCALFLCATFIHSPQFSQLASPFTNTHRAQRL